MTANVNPIFVIVPNIASDGATGMSPTVLTATGDYTGVSANHVQVWKANTNSSWIERLRFKAIGTNIATVARIYLNNGSTHTTATNNTFYDEVTLPATTATNTAATNTIEVPMNFAMLSGWTIWVGLATTVVSGWDVSAIGADY